MFKLALIQAIYGVKTKWKERRIQGNLVIWIIIIMANSLAWFEKDSIAWFWTTYGLLLLIMTMFAIDENVFPEIFRFLPITHEKKKSFLLCRAMLETIIEIILIGIMFLIFIGIKGSMDLVIVMEAALFLVFSIERFGQNWLLGFCKVVGIKHIYDCEPERKSSKIVYWFFTSLDIVAILGLLISIFFMKDVLTVWVVWRICEVFFIYCVLSILWRAQILKRCMNKIAW